MSEGDQEHIFVRAQWAEMCGHVVSCTACHDIVAEVPGCIIIDARACYDAIHKGLACAGSALGLKEKTTAIELMALMESLERHQTLVRWAHANAQLADALTKPSAKAVFRDFLATQRWKIVHDDAMRSAKVRAKAGLDKMEDYRSEEHSNFFQLARKETMQAWWNFHQQWPLLRGLRFL